MDPLDIEAVLIAWLAKELGLPVSADVPDPRPKTFITVERVGGARDSVVVDRPSVAVQCWASSRAQAATLAYRVSALIPRLAFIDRVARAEQDTLYNFPDLEGGNPRYQVVIDLVTT